MAHNLARDAAGAVRMAYRGESPWHRLGAIGPEHGTVEQWVEAARLNYKVGLAPLYLSGSTGMIECPIRQAIIRDGDVTAVLGTVGMGYEPIQNADAFGIVGDLIDLGKMEIETAGALGKGETAWMLLKNGQEIEVRSGDAVKPRLLVVTSHDGTRSLQAIPTAVRVVCQNTLNAVRDRAALNIRHTSSAGERIKTAQAILADYGRTMETTAAQYRAMAAKDLQADDIRQYLATVFPKPKTSQAPAAPQGVGADLVAELLGIDATTGATVPVNVRVSADQMGLMGVPLHVANVNGKDSVEDRRDAVEYLIDNGSSNGRTAWGAYNAVAEYVDHVYVARADGSPRLNGAASALFGSGAAMKARAWDAARKMFVDVTV